MHYTIKTKHLFFYRRRNCEPTWRVLHPNVGGDALPDELQHRRVAKNKEIQNTASRRCACNIDTVTTIIAYC